MILPFDVLVALIGKLQWVYQMRRLEKGQRTCVFQPVAFCKVFPISGFTSLCEHRTITGILCILSCTPLKRTAAKSSAIVVKVSLKKSPLLLTLASHAGVFRGARISCGEGRNTSSPKNARGGGYTDPHWNRSKDTSVPTARFYCSSFRVNWDREHL